MILETEVGHIGVLFILVQQGAFILIVWENQVITFARATIENNNLSYICENQESLRASLDFLSVFVLLGKSNIRLN